MRYGRDVEYTPHNSVIKDKNSQSFEVSQLTRAYLDQVLEIESKVYPECWSRALFEESLDAPMTYGIILVQNERCVAYSIFQVIFNEGHLLNVAVAPEFQCRGVGGMFLDCILSEVRVLGASHMFLEVRPTNTAAIALYKSRGFQKLTIRPRYYSDGEDALIFSTSFEK